MEPFLKPPHLPWQPSAVKQLGGRTQQLQQRPKHGGDRQQIDFSTVFPANDAMPDTLLAMDEAMGKLAREAPEQAKLIKLRYYTGCSLSEVAR